MLQHERDQTNHPGQGQEQDTAIGLGGRLLAGLRSLGRHASDVVIRHKRDRNKRQAELALLRQSELFDADWYLAAYPDVASEKIDPVLHFLISGWREGRNPSPRFGTTYYLRRNPDVAALGINPLVHFIEYGRFEGREIGGMGDLPWADRRTRKPRGDLSPAMPVFDGARVAQPMRPWLRACNLAVASDTIEVDGLVLAMVARPEDRPTAELVLDDFEQFSDGRPDVLPVPPVLGELPALANCWFAAGSRLVTCWHVAEPTVIRAVQFDPVMGRLALVGEGLAQTAIDPVQFDLASTAMPLLFLATSPEGELRGTGRLAFPSLARGGMHYPEFVDALGKGMGVDLMATSAEYEAALRLLRARKATAAVRELELDLAGASGNEPMFRSDLRHLLERVLMVDISPTANFQPRVGSYLSDAARLSAARTIRTEGGSLTLAADMVPGLRTLVSLSREQEEIGCEPQCELIVCDVDPAQPSVKFSLPLSHALIPGLRSKSYPLPFPLMRNAGRHCIPLGIRKSVRQLDDAEYLAPDLSLQPDEKVATQALCWMMDWSDGNELLLSQSLTALSLQQGIGTQLVCFLRPPNALVRAVADSAFAGRWKTVRDMEEAVASTDADLVGYLGNGVVLHDQRTAAMLATVLLDKEISSASCTMVSSFRHGKSWRPLLVDDGHLPVDVQLTYGSVSAGPAEMIWRASYTAIQPSSHLWIARPGDVRRWLSKDPAADELHVVTSNITASLEAGARAERHAHPLYVRPASKERSIKLQVLVG